MERNSLPKNRRMEIIYICKEHQNRKRAYSQSLKALKEKGETTLEVKKYIAVEEALEEIEPLLRKALWENIVYRIPYEHLDIPMGRQGFYLLRRQFLSTISHRLDVA